MQVENQKVNIAGICFDKNQNKPYRVRVYRNHKTHFIGRFLTKDEAVKARDNFLQKFIKKEFENQSQILL